MIINDRRYGALRSLGERKQTFNEVNIRSLSGVVYDGYLLCYDQMIANNCTLLRNVLVIVSVICISVCGAEEKTGS